MGCAELRAAGRLPARGRGDRPRGPAPDATGSRSGGRVASRLHPDPRAVCAAAPLSRAAYGGGRVRQARVRGFDPISREAYLHTAPVLGHEGAQGRKQLATDGVLVVAALEWLDGERCLWRGRPHAAGRGSTRSRGPRRARSAPQRRARGRLRRKGPCCRSRGGRRPCSARRPGGGDRRLFRLHRRRRRRWLGRPEARA